jgi:ethanolamine utilization protein EutN
MYYARVIGNIVSTIKHKGLKGKKIQVIQPVDMKTGKDSGGFLVALDATSSGVGDMIGYEDGTEASWAFEEDDEDDVPVDASIVAIIDKINITG